MSAQKINLIFFKEMKDILRDRRTLYSMILVPILMYPLLSIGMGALIGSQMEKTQAAKQRIVILGEEYAPKIAQAIRNTDKFTIVPVDSLERGLRKLAAADSTIDRKVIDRIFSPAGQDIPDSIIYPIFSRAIDEKIIRAAVRFPENFATRIETGDSLNLIILYDQSETKSDAAADKLRDWAIEYRDSLVTAHLVELHLDRSVIKPFWILRDNVASPERMGGLIMGMMLPYLMLILVLVGGMYPALDLTAGEKERNTLETLLAAPVSRFDIAAGKFLTTFVASMVTMLLSLISMTITAKFGFASMAEGAIQISMSPGTVVWLLFMMIPAATLFSALQLTVAIAAKSYKEGQSYLTPILMVVILPAMAAFIPGVELEGGLLFVPVVNLVLSLKEIILGTYKVWRLLTVFGVTSCYALVALFFAKRIFERESVLFRT